MKTRTRRLLAELHELLDGPDESELQRDVVAAELAAAACRATLRGGDTVEAERVARNCLAALPRNEWLALFDRARALARSTSGDRDWPTRSAALERLISAIA